MRVDYTGIGEFTRTNRNVEAKGSNTVKTETAGISGDISARESVHGITATTVEKALFSLESQLDKIKQAAQDVDLDVIKTQMAVLSNTLSGEDLKQLEEAGYSLNDTQVKTIVTVMDKIKAELAKGGMDIRVFGEDLSMEQLEDITGSAGQARQMASELKNCQDGEIAYLADNGLEPTIENLYWAQHSGSRQENPESLTIPEDENLQRQMAQVITQAGLPVNETTMGYGALLLNNQIPLTAENVAYVDRLKQLELPLPEPEIEAAIAEAVAQGDAPKEAYMLEGYSDKDRAMAAMETILEADDQELAAVVESGKPLTVETLQEARRDREGRKGVERDDSSLRFITAKRQLEETRLVMTAQANYQLLKQGISIETEELEQLVEELKGIEKQYYKSLLEEQGIDPTDENAGIFQETTEKTEGLKQLPAYALGRYVDTVRPASVNELYEGGKQLEALLEQANEAYETMMTEPRKDMGDSIQKAFGNVDDILEDLGMETSQPNRRAVRILAYNQTEITPDTIKQIKAADEKVQNLFQNLKPAVVMEMIREGIHPLEMDVASLNAKAQEIAADLDPGQEEKFSNYLWKLEQNHEITQEEKESSIGIFRLLRQIEKTDGAVIGAVVNQGGELSLRNLLSAVRSRNVQGMDITADAEFGGLESGGLENSITRQIDTAYQTDCAKEAFGKLTPENLQKCMENPGWQELTPEQLLWQMKEQQTVEQQETYQRQREQLSAGRVAEDKVLQLLKEYDIPVDTYHIMAAGQLMNNRNQIFRKLFQWDETNPKLQLQEAKEALLQKFSEAVKTPEDMARAQKELAETAEHIMDTMVNEEQVSSLDVRDLKVLRTQIQLTGKMSREENYCIPVLIGDEMTNVQLKIVRGTEKRGMAEVIFGTEKLGKIAAQIQVTGQKVEGLVVSERQELQEKLKEQEAELMKAVQPEEGQEVKFDFLVQENLELSEFSQSRQTRTEQKSSDEYQIQTRQLYGAAKAFIETVKRAV